MIRHLFIAALLMGCTLASIVSTDQITDTLQLVAPDDRLGQTCISTNCKFNNFHKDMFCVALCKTVAASGCGKSEFLDTLRGFARRVQELDNAKSLNIGSRDYFTNKGDCLAMQVSGWTFQHAMQGSTPRPTVSPTSHYIPDTFSWRTDKPNNFQSLRPIQAMRCDGHVPDCGKIVVEAAQDGPNAGSCVTENASKLLVVATPQNAVCRDGGVVTGIRCTTPYCETVELTCKKFTLKSGCSVADGVQNGAHSTSEAMRPASPRPTSCSKGSVMVGMECRKRRCDYIKILCAKLQHS